MSNQLDLQTLTESFRRGEEVSPSEMKTIFDLMTSERRTHVLVAALNAWNDKGFSEAELFSLAKTMRQRMTRLSAESYKLVDIVGTGGSTVKSFNVSTAAAIVVAGAGVRVAKHGNRAASSCSGSSDVLERLGVEIDISPRQSERLLSDYGICFLFAPRFHALSPTLAAARREVARPTIFNCVGPLCNPASPAHSLVGVSRKEWLEPVSNALARLGTACSWVVHGLEGLDEISANGETLVAEVNGPVVKNFSVSPADFGLSSEARRFVIPSDANGSARIIADVLAGKSAGDYAERVVLINAAAALYLAGAASTLPSAYRAAEESLISGRADAKLAALRGSK